MSCIFGILLPLAVRVVAWNDDVIKDVFTLLTFVVTAMASYIISIDDILVTSSIIIVSVINYL